MQDNKQHICVVVASCDRYYDLWDPFFHFFEKYWPDCPYPVYLATNSKIYKRNNIQQVFSNKFSTWSEETHIALAQIPCDYMIYLQDDYFLNHNVENEVIKALVDKTSKYNASYLRLFPSPGPDAAFKEDPKLGLISENAPYRSSLQSAIWRKTDFLKLLNMKESQWNFEMLAGRRSKELIFLSVFQQKKGSLKKHVYPITYFYLTAVLRGKWRWQAARICRKENVTIDTEYRAVESYSEMLFQKLYEALPLFLKKIVGFMSSRLLKK